jgi:hypothetical protein
VALLNFPNPATNGQLYPTNPLVGQNQYQYEAATQTWRLLGAATTVVPGCYGDGTNVAAICVDAQGRLTSAVNVPIAANTPDLQQVTTQGAVTTDTIDVGGLIAAGLTYPTADGGAGSVLTTDGSGNLSFLTLLPPDLQAVTDVGASTTNGIGVGSLVAAGLLYPIVDGASGDYLTTDGAGNLSWLTPPATPDLDAVTSAGNTTLNSIDVGSLTAASLNYPLADGTADQVMTTDGGGNLGWLSTLKVVTAPTGSGDPGALGEVAIDTGFFYFFDGTNWLQVAGSIF